MRREAVIGVIVTAILLGGGPRVAEASLKPLAGECATLAARFIPDTPHPGDSVTFKGKVTSCSSQAETVKVKGHVTGPCGVDVRRSRTVTLLPGETKAVNATFLAPPCFGTYTGVGKAISLDGVLLDKVTTSLTVN
jgi:hypothetical protein